jgi:hypothetical protein
MDMAYLSLLLCKGGAVVNDHRRDAEHNPWVKVPSTSRWRRKGYARRGGTGLDF